MAAKEAIVRLFDYTEWANHLFLDGVAALPAEDFARDLHGSHGGVRGTLVHTYGAERVWLERFKGTSPTSGPTEADFADVAALRDRWTVLETERRAWISSLPRSAGNELVTYRNFKGEVFSTPLWPLVQHLANHGSYHRGQVAAFLRQLGVKPPSTDLVVFDRLRSTAGR
jgi:uncharacterized damage-inducible protein DinB